jgi:hypothetical protein
MFGLRYREDLQTGQTSMKEYVSNFTILRGKLELTVLIPGVLGRHDDAL